MSRPAWMLLLALGSLGGCGGDASDDALFELLTPEQTGVTFANTITTSDTLNVQTDPYVYNGGGVAAGDIDNDGLTDIFFAGNMVSSRLYLNTGAMRFDDITARAGVTTTRWATGATMVDINADGYLDIYVSVSGPERSKAEDRANLLFVNNRNRTFTEAAARYGIADTGFTTHGVFLDYDRDGCLDLFLLNNSPKDFSRGVSGQPTIAAGATPGSYNYLYRNDCRGGTPGTFIDVSAHAGVARDPGFGLGAAVADLNRDGWPDIYVSNDVEPNDVVYVNTGRGTFTNKAATWLKHGSFAGMGVDIADFNDDGWPDILQVDMLPQSPSDRKRMSGATTYGALMRLRSKGFRDDFTANALQLSNGVTRSGDVIFSDVARLAGVVATGWSWSALFADFDNDGRKDIFISNGYPKAVNDLDYQTAFFTLGRRGGASRRGALDLLGTLPGYEEANVVFQNAGDLTFTDKTRAWGMERPSFSYGAAYADLDNDGKLDLIVSNIDAPAFIYHNVGSNNEPHHYLDIRLEGDSPHHAIGSTLVLTIAGHKQYLYYNPYRGFMSTMDARAHFGLGRARRVDSLEVHWPDGRYQLLTGLDANQVLVVRQANAARTTAAKDTSDASRPFEPVDSRRTPKYKHESTVAVDYSVQPLLPYMISRQGPPLAVGDVDGDSLDDVFVGGSSGAAGKLFIQRADGGFVETTQVQPWDAEPAYEDWGALLFDANGDGRLDLYLASGGYHMAPGSPVLEDRLYINQGRGRFARDSAALPAMLTSTAAVRAGDFDGDGRLDLFVGGRLTPRRYPYPARSYVLRNEGGRFTDVTDAVAPELAAPGGMITDASWLDFDGDGRLDLVTVGEWMPIQFYRNDGTALRNVTRSTRLPSLRGWWYSLAAGDFDNDGRPDLVAGNLGLNHSYATSTDRRLGVYASNFTGNQTTDVVLAQTVDGIEYPVAGMAPLGREIYTTALKFPTYASFARAPLAQLFSAAQLQESLHYEADTFASLFLHNEGGGTFSASPLPNLAQISPIRAIVAHDVDGDGHRDLIVAGNLYDTEPNTPRADAGNGLWLRGDGQGRFAPVSASESGFLAPLNVSGLALLTTRASKAVLVANTGDSLQAFRIRDAKGAEGAEGAEGAKGAEGSPQRP
ncbi:MAG TPA: VCBS repeat-containing protein [Gemmatimonadaceae bacterium]|nr:VCBS repeat-containing protein [Gemmatimonadaceae bacterium]